MSGYAAAKIYALPESLDTYTRLNVTDPASGIQSKVELVAEFLHHPPVPSELGPVLHPDDGFDAHMFADSLARIQRYTDKQFAAYGLDATEAAALREQFADWQRQLTAPKDDNPAQKRAAAAATASPSSQQPPVPQNPATNPNTPPPGPGSSERPQPGGRRRR